MAAAPWTDAVERAWQPRAQSGHWLRGRWTYLVSQDSADPEPDIYTTERGQNRLGAREHAGGGGGPRRTGIQQADGARAATEGGTEQKREGAARRAFCEVFAFTATPTGRKEGRKEDENGGGGTKRTSGGVGMRKARRSGTPRAAAEEGDKVAEVQEGVKTPPPSPRRLRAILRPHSPAPPTGHCYAGKALAARSGSGTLADRKAIPLA